MDITFSAANAIGLNNPGTEIITLIKDGGGNFINPPSYDKMRAYLRSGEVPMLFVTTEGGETGSLYQLVEYSETENKIRFSNDANAIEFSVGAAAPVVTDVVPKPLTYDYMPEGYPSKTQGTITPMAEEFIPAAALITYDSNSHTYSYDLTYFELLARLLDGKPVVVHRASDNEYLYLTKWKKMPDGNIHLAFAGFAKYSAQLSIDGTISAIS